MGRDAWKRHLDVVCQGGRKRWQGIGGELTDKGGGKFGDPVDVSTR